MELISRYFWCYMSGGDWRWNFFQLRFWRQLWQQASNNLLPVGLEQYLEPLLDFYIVSHACGYFSCFFCLPILLCYVISIMLVASAVGERNGSSLATLNTASPSWHTYPGSGESWLLERSQCDAPEASVGHTPDRCAIFQPIKGLSQGAVGAILNIKMSENALPNVRRLSKKEKKSRDRARKNARVAKNNLNVAQCSRWGSYNEQAG